MKIEVLQIDVNGYIVEPLVINQGERLLDDEGNERADIVYDKPKGLHTPMWNGIEWEEGLTTTEIEAIKNTPRELTPIELLQQENSSLIIDNIEKENRIMQLEQQQADLTLELVSKGVI